MAPLFASDGLSPLLTREVALLRASSVLSLVPAHDWLP
jgi:hypothetical protein